MMRAHLMYANLRRRRTFGDFTRRALRVSPLLRGRRMHLRMLARLRDARETMTPSGRVVYFCRRTLRSRAFDPGKPL